MAGIIPIRIMIRQTLEIFGILVETGSRIHLMAGYLFGAGFMLSAAGIEGFLGIKAERKSLKEIAVPLSADA